MSVSLIEELAKDPNLELRIVKEVGKTVKDDDHVIRTVFHVCLSASSTPLNLADKGVTSIGKSYGTLQTTGLFPSEDVEIIAAMSPKELPREHGVLVNKRTGSIINPNEKPKKPPRAPVRPKKDRYQSSDEYCTAYSEFYAKNAQHKKATEEYERATTQYNEDLQNNVIIVNRSTF